MENIGLKFIKFKIIHFLLFLIIGGGFISSLVFAYSPYYTHPDLTEEIAKLWNLKNNEQELKISQNEIEWMREGAIDEDTPARWINHFYDPINNVGWKGKHFGTLSQAEGLYSGESMAPKKAIASIDWVVNQEYQATYGRQYGNQTWQKAISSYIDGNKKSAFIALGHILHLVEDASVPDHTRNDTHADLYGDTASPYEEYTKNYTNFNKLTIAEDLKNKTLQNFPTIQDAFNYIANYSNNNFFSKDTISNKEFSSPDLKRLIKKKGYLYDGKNNIYLAQYQQKDAEITYSLNDSTLILPSYFTHLAPQAVSTGASVLNLFFQEVEKYKNNPPEIIPDSNESILTYAQKSPILMAVNTKDVYDKTIIDSQILLAKVGNAVVTAYNFTANTIGNTYDSAVNLISRLASDGDSPNNNSASVLLATTQNPTVADEQEVVDNIQSLPQTTQDSIIPASAPSQAPVQTPTIKSTVGLPPTLSTPTTGDLVVGVLSGVSYGGGATPQVQQETQQTLSTSSTGTTENTTTSATVTYINGVTPTDFATTTLSSATTTFSGTYNNSASFDRITFELKNTSQNTATSSIVRAIATTTGEGLAYSEQITLESEGNWQYRAHLEDSVNASSAPWSTMFFFTLATSTTATTTSGTASSSPAYLIVSQQNDHSTFDTTSGSVQGYGIQKNVVLSQPVTFTGVNNGDQGRIILWYYFGYGQDCSTVGSVILSTGPSDSTNFSPISATPNWDGSCVFRLANANGSVSFTGAQPYVLFLYNSFTHAGPYAYGKVGGNSNAVYCRGSGIYANSCTDLVEYSTNLSDFAYTITSDTYTPPSIPSGVSPVPSTASPVAAEQADHSMVDATTQPNMYPIQRNVVLSHKVTFTGANIGDKGRIVAWYSFASGQDCSNVGMVALATGPADSTSFVPLSKTPTADGICVFHLGNANASVIKEVGEYALYMGNSGYSLGVPRPFGKSGGNSNAVFCAGSGIYANSCSDFRGYSTNLSDFAYIVTEDTYGMNTPDTTPPVITSATLSPSSGYATTTTTITLTIVADAAGYSLGTTTVNGVQVTGFTDTGMGTYTATYGVGSGNNDRALGTIPVSIILVDSAGNKNTEFTTAGTNTLKLDAHLPILLSAQVTSTTTVDVLFSEDLNGSTVTNNDFSITGHTLALPDAFEVSPGLVRLAVDIPFVTGETSEILYNTTVSNGVKDLAGNVALAASVMASGGVW